MVTTAIKQQTMFTRIGVLLPRSTDYPAMAYDILDGLRSWLTLNGQNDYSIYIENIGFGEDMALNYAKAEKLALQDQTDIIIAYCHATNAEALYPLADALHKPFLFIDAGMQLPQGAVSPYCYHITLQGLHACRVAGHMAGAGNRKVLMATSFYDGGYRGPWGYDKGLSEAGGSVCGNFVSGYNVSEFTITPYLGLLRQTTPTSVAACFSSNQAELFFKALHEKNGESTPWPFYCSPFMAEEQWLNKCDFPGGEFYAVVPWASSVKNEEQEQFLRCIQAEKNKAANIFHLLGWEAGMVTMSIQQMGVQAVKNFSYNSPRGKTTIHPGTHYTYAPLYQGTITGDENGKCVFNITNILPPDATMHEAVMNDRPQAVVSGWKNNYLCF